jgi:hypothetical protein
MPIHFPDKDGHVKAVAVEQKGSQAPAPTSEYHPTLKLVRCRECKIVGAAEFAGGFNIADGDKIMDGKPVIGFCLRCNRETELVPVPTSEANTRELKLYYQMQKSLEEYAKRGERISPSGIVWPIERVKERERQFSGQ